MPLIRMTHPQRGEARFAERDVPRLEKLGWKRQRQPKKQAPKAPETDSGASSLPEHTESE